MDVLREPARGGFVPPEFSSMPGLDGLRAMVEGRVPRPPWHHLMGIRLTHVTAGSVTLTMPASPWFQVGPGVIAVGQILIVGHVATARSIMPAGFTILPMSIGADYVRTPMVSMERFVARGRVIVGGRSAATTELVLEDASGQIVMHSTAQMVFAPAKEHVPSVLGDLPPYVEPSYPSPDPPLRPLPADLAETARRSVREPFASRVASAGADTSRLTPLAALLGARFTRLEAHEVAIELPTSDWHRSEFARPGTYPFVSLASMACGFAMRASLNPDRAAYSKTFHIAFIEADPAVWRELTTLHAVGRTVHNEGSTIVADADVRGDDGRLMGTARATGRPFVIDEASIDLEPERVLATVLFVDVVDSTPTAERLGDSAWRDVLERARAVSRDSIAGQRGREVKNTGDGFLATFDSPQRAIRCAAAVREGFAGLGVQVRAGVHLGEIELVDEDVAGIGVHVAQRVESLAAPGTIWVTSTVRQAMAGSGIAFEARGSHELKGVSDTWDLFEVV